MKKKCISVITPLFNEEENLPEFKRRIEAVFDGLPEYSYEVLLIDNCSTDGSREWCERVASEHDCWRYVRFSRNFKPETSIAVGFHYARGDAAIVVFSDLQDPPELIPEFIAKWEEGNDIVSGIVRKRSDANIFYNIASRAIYFILYFITSPRIERNATDFKLLDRCVVNALKKAQERVRYNRGLINWLGYRSHNLVYDRTPRQRGRSYASTWHRIDFAISAVTSFTIYPLRLIFLSGLALMGFSLCMIAYRLYIYFSGSPIPGNTTTYTLLLMSLGWQGITIGVLGEYLSKVLVETRKRPRWIIAHMTNFPADQVPDTVRLEKDDDIGS